MKNNEIENRIYPQPDVFNLFYLLKKLWMKKWLILIIPFLLSLVSVVLTLRMPDLYKATSTVLPVSNDQSSMSQYNNLASLAGLNLSSDSSSSLTTIMAVLNSRTLKNRIIDDLNLIEVLLVSIPENLSPMYAAIEVFSSNFTAIQDNRSGLITIAFVWSDPEIAAMIVNEVTKTLSSILDEKNLTASSKKLTLIEMQLDEKKQYLDTVKSKMLEFQRRTQVIRPESQAEGVMELHQSLIRQKVALEVELETLSEAMSENNPSLIAKQNQITAINNQLNTISTLNTNVGVNVNDIPENIAEYSEINAELELAQNLYISVFSLLEQMRMKEQEDHIYVEVIDDAIIPEYKDSPRRSIIVLATGVISFFIVLILSAIIIIFKE